MAVFSVIRTASGLPVFFNQHRTGAADLTLATFAYTYAAIVSDSLSIVNGSSSELLTFSYAHGTVSSNGASVAYDWQSRATP
jgi:hypothetical protein